MIRRTCPLFIVAGFLAVLLAQAPAQPPEQPPPAVEAPKREPPKRDPEDYPNYVGKPETVEEFWSALRFEIDVGEFDIAARLMQGLLDLKPNKDALLELEEKHGMAALLRLRAVPQWSKDVAVDKKAKSNVETLIKDVAAALKERLEDPRRIAKFVKNLTASPEERAFALKELYRSGAAVIPPLVEALRSAVGEDRVAILSALPRFSSAIVPPLLAGLESDDPRLQIDVIDVLERRAEKSAIPWLWYPSAGPRQAPEVHQAAKRALAFLLETPADRLPPAKAALTREAERYYLHQVKFTDPGAVVVWRWDANSTPHIVSGWPQKPTLTASQAEEYYGNRFANQALDLDPTYKPAQVILLSLALDKAVERIGPDVPLGKAEKEAAVNNLLSTVNSELVLAVLDRALTERRVNVILATVRILGERHEARAIQPVTQGEPPLVRALNFPDRRVQMAAAESLLLIPGSAASGTSARVLEVLRRAIAAEPQANARVRVLIGFENPALAGDISAAVNKAGFEPVLVTTGREMLRRLHQGSDIDVVLLDSALPDPGLSSLLAQIRGDVYAGRLPIVLSASSEQDATLRRLREEYREASRRMDLSRERAESFRTRNLASLGTQSDQESDRLRKTLDDLSKRYGAESLRVEDRLRRFAEYYANIYVVPADLPLDAVKVKRVLQERIAQADSPPLGEAQRKEYAERAMLWLGAIARGEVAGYDLRSAPAVADSVLTALTTPGFSDAAVAAGVNVIARLPGSKEQRALAAILLDAKRALPIRALAADELVRHIQRFSPALSPGDVAALQQLATATTDTTLTPRVEVVIGSLRPDARQTGERLKSYTPPLPGGK